MIQWDYRARKLEKPKSMAAGEDMKTNEDDRTRGKTNCCLIF